VIAAILLGLAVPAGASAPASPARAVAEWEPAHGTLIRYPLGIPYSLCRALAEDDTLYVLCETAGSEASARSALQNNGVDIAHCRFLRIGTYSHWTRDWGPHAVFDANGDLGITDPIFNGYPWVPPDAPAAPGKAPAVPGNAPVVPANVREAGARGYEEDDAVNAALGVKLGCPVWAMPAYATGGNFMTDGFGIAFSTTQMVNENLPLMTEEEFVQYARDYLGITTYHFLHGTEDFGIQHIDCWAKLLDEETILVKRPPVWHEEYPRIEQNLQTLAGLTNCHGRPYRIVRIDTPPYNSYDIAAYTNSLILNGKVLVPTFGIPGDAAALDVYRDAMPGYEVIGFAGSGGSPWYYYDALHCRAMAIFDGGMLRLAHRRLDAEMPPLADSPVRALIDDRSEAGLIPAELRVFWRRHGETPWQSVPFTALAAPDSFEARIPGQPRGTVVEYYLAAADLSGRHETLPRVAPAGFFSFLATEDLAGAGGGGAPLGDRSGRFADGAWRVLPNPFAAATTVEAKLREGAVAVVRVIDPTGREVRTLTGTAGAADRAGGAGTAVLTWDGRDASGEIAPAGIYWLLLDDATVRTAKKVVRVR
jgi:agmatine/peptidylarginine deiminase